MRIPTAGTVKLGELLSSKIVLAVPWHQRHYDWKEGEVNRLLDDFGTAYLGGKQFYFLGAVTLVKDNGSKMREINDGQQRIITFSLICARLGQLFGDALHAPRLEEHALSRLFDLSQQHDFTWKDANKLSRLDLRVSPSEADTDTYRKLILTGGGTRNSEKLVTAWKIVTEILKSHETRNPGFCKGFFDFLLNAVHVVNIEIPPSVDPYDIFETLNDRGKGLEQIDLVKNYMLSHYKGEEESERRKTVYKQYYGTYTALNKDIGVMASYARCYSQARFKHMSEKRFYRELRDKIEDVDKKKRCDFIAHFIRDLGEKADFYKRFVGRLPAQEQLRKIPLLSRLMIRRRTLFHYLRDLKNYTVAKPVLFALFCRLLETQDQLEEKKEFAKLLDMGCRNLSSLITREAHTQAFQPSNIERELADLAHYIWTRRHATSAMFNAFQQKLRRADKDGFMSDAKYIDVMSMVEFKQHGKARQILEGIVNFHQGAEIPRTSVEHILPKGQEHLDGWEFTADEHRRFVHRLGNLTLLESKLNKGDSDYNRNFEKKKNTFRKSAVDITRDCLAELPDWNPRRVDSRQRYLAERAAKVWDFKTEKSK